TSKAFNPEDLKIRVKIPAARRTLGYFRERKFAAEGVISRLQKYGFTIGNYQKIIVTWGWTNEAKNEADAADIELWDFRDVVGRIATTIQHETSYFTDDTLRTIGLYVKACKELSEDKRMLAV